MSARRRFPLFVSTLLVAVLLAACGPAAGEGEASRRLEVEDFSYARHVDGVRVVTGKLYNTSAEPVVNVMVSVALYDASNRRVGTIRVPVREVPPGKRASFREVVDVADVHGARVHSVVVM